MGEFRVHNRKGKLRQIPAYCLNQADAGKILVSPETQSSEEILPEKRELFTDRTVGISRGTSSSIS